MPDELEGAEQLVAVRHVALALEHLDLHAGLVVVGGGEHLRALRGDRGVALDELGHDLTLGLDAERQRRDVEQQDVLDVALEHAGLERRAHCDGFVGVDALVGVLARELLDEVGDRRHARGATHEDHAVDVVLVEARVADRLLERTAARVEQVARELLELRAGEREVEVQRTVARRRDERQVHGGLLQRRQLDLRLLRGFLEPLHGHLVGTEVDAVRVLELGDEPVDDALVPVVTAEVGVAGGRLHLEHTLAEVEDRHVERAAPEVEHEDRLVVVTLVEAVRQGRGGGLVDDAQHLETGDLTGLLRGLALGVAEVRGHRDHRLGDAVAEVRLGVALELPRMRAEISWEL